MESFKESGLLFELMEWKEEYKSVIAGMTMREGGTSEAPYHSLNMGFHVNDNPETVRTNRTIVSAELNIPADCWTGSEQVHQAHIHKVSAKDAGFGSMDYESAIKMTDGLYTAEQDVFLTSLYADCVPLYFYNHRKKLAGLAHAGWKGTALDIGGQMVKRWADDEGAEVQDIMAAIGPSIGPCCYEVDDYVMSRMTEVLGNKANRAAAPAGEGKYMLDLKEANRQLLISSGIREENITVSNFCTSCRNDLFFSYRKDGGVTGRMMSYIMLKGDSPDS
ncbi:peptidoglycan editing factor PgeF [Fictibacillus iocasae]|uniref:Purine nucleoside phosphorylase n=1 Tax=Fictibacillus iocasae TaxID=2715437 RepID=A0ABW2NTX5_9BACL